MQRTAIGTTTDPRIRLSSALRAAWRLIRVCAARRRQRHVLALLDDRALGDIGLSRCDMLREIAKPCWRE